MPPIPIPWRCPSLLNRTEMQHGRSYSMLGLAAHTQLCSLPLENRADSFARLQLMHAWRLQVGSSSGGSAFVGNFGASKQLNGLMAATRSGLTRPSFMGPASGSSGSPTARPGPAAGPSGRSKGAFSKWTSRVRERL